MLQDLFCWALSGLLVGFYLALEAGKLVAL